MADAEASPDCSYSDLARIVDENCEPFDSLAQCRRFMKAAVMLRRRTPEETEGDGQRVIMRDLQVQIDQARRAMNVFLIGSQGPTVIVPNCDLR